MKLPAEDRKVVDKVEQARRRRWAALAGAGVGLLVFALYLATLAPTVLYYSDQMKDSAVLPAIAYTLGISHPTGYPTYTLLTYLFTFLPIGDVAYRVNLSSAVFGAGAVALLYATGFRLSGRIPAAAIGAVAFGVSGLFWSQAVIAEVYTLHILFLALNLFVLLVWREKRQDRYLLLIAFLIGLSMTHNLTSGLLLPAAALFVLLVEPKKVLQWRLVLGGVGLFLAALLPYAYLPLRARMDPPLNIDDPSNWERFEDLITGGQFKGNMWAFGPEELPGRFLMYLDHLSGQLHWAIVMAAVVGFLYLLFRDRAAAAMLGFLYAGFLLYALEYDIEDVFFYFIPTYALLAVSASVGLGALLGEAETIARRFGPGARRATAATVSLLALVAALWGLPGTYREVDMSDEHWGRELMDVVEREAAPNAIIIQHRTSLFYMILVEGRRDDIDLWGYRQPDDERENAEAVTAAREGRLYVVPTPDKRSQPERAGNRLVPIEEDLLYRVEPPEG